MYTSCNSWFSRKPLSAVSFLLTEDEYISHKVKTGESVKLADVVSKAVLNQARAQRTAVAGEWADVEARDLLC